jgi:hypothetical protein
MSTVPRIEIEAPAEFASLRRRFESLDTERLAGITERVGLEDPGPVIRVVLAPESSELARDAAPWIAGYARGGEVVIFPARSPGYPHTSLDDVLRHEIAHILIARASGGQSVPRWFNEGLAMSTERSWRIEDQTRLLYQLVAGPAESLSQLERLFSGGESRQARAYTLASAFVRDLLEQHGQDAAGKILARMRGGETFDRAFIDVTGLTLDAAESEFWKRQRVWTTWAPLLTSSAVIWMIVTIIALLAIRSRRRKDAALHRKWDEEDGELP